MAVTNGEIPCESDLTGMQQLLGNGRGMRPKEKCPPQEFSYRLIKIPGKRAVFMILYNVFFSTTALSIYEKGIENLYPWLEGSNLHLIPHPVIALFLLSVGLATETCIGHYRFLTASLYFWLTSIVFTALGLIIPSKVFVLLRIFTKYASLGCYASCAIPFTIDQLVGASGEELSFTIYWLAWAWWAFFGLAYSFPCYSPKGYQVHQAVRLSIQSLAFISAYVMMQCCGHVLMTRPQVSNPVKLVVRVLGYAWKHKYPERRSAFTYWEDECPSRIDLGKNKYGGPFTVEEVENVKTVFKLIPLIFCIVVTSVIGVYEQLHVHPCEVKDVNFYFSFLQVVVMIVWLPFYHLLVYPFFYNYVTSMLRRIGIGICLILSSKLFDTTVCIALFEQDFLDAKCTAGYARSVNSILPLGEWFLLLSHLVRILTVVFMTSIALEFFMAQAPCQVRGLVSSISLSAFGTFEALLFLLHLYVHSGLVFNIVLCVTVFVFFVIFVYAANWYKLRKRDDVIPYHMFAENQFESDYRQQREWLKSHEQLFESSSSSIESQ